MTHHQVTTAAFEGFEPSLTLQERFHYSYLINTLGRISLQPIPGQLTLFEAEQSPSAEIIQMFNKGDAA